MGGYGSGRPSHKQKAEDWRSLDVNRFHREGCLRPGRQGNWVWSRDSDEVGRIGYNAEDGRLVLDYRVRQYGGEWEPITETIRITQTDCHFGNKRPYFYLPRRGQWSALWAARRQAVLRRAIFPMSPLLQHRLCQPVRGPL